MNPFDTMGMGFNPWDPQNYAGAAMPPSNGMNAAPGLPSSIPELIASNFANKGIAPQDFLKDPNAASAALTNGTAPPPVGASLDPRPPGMVAPQPVGAPVMASPPADPLAAAAAPTGSIGDRLAATLKGAKMPPAPAVQTIHSPAVPAPHGTIKSGGLLALLQALGVPSANQPHMPFGLGQAIGGR